MPILDRVRAWLFGADDSEPSESGGNTESTSEGSGEPRLDPDNVTQVRSARDDDPVSQLRDTRERTEDGEESDA
jgi:hypothetical protein